MSKSQPKQLNLLDDTEINLDNLNLDDFGLDESAIARLNHNNENY